MMSRDENPKFLFISDLHLGGFDAQKNTFLDNLFADIVDYAIRNQFNLVIHGDLLDYYMQYNDWIPDVAKYPFQVLTDYNQRANSPAIYITGNHDNWDVNYIEKIGCIVIHESYDVQINGTNVFITHGDGLNDPKFNFPRPILHRFLRNRYFVRLFKLLTGPLVGNTIMRTFSKLTRSRSSTSDSGTIKLDNWAIALLKKFNYDVVICGHHHQLRYIENSYGIYINTGCFYSDLAFAIYTNKGFELVIWNNITNDILPWKPLQ
jgi:UDP-2,3-diacylglucosamine pyrophosphatase LpxH